MMEVQQYMDWADQEIAAGTVLQKGMLVVELLFPVDMIAEVGAVLEKQGARHLLTKKEETVYLLLSQGSPRFTLEEVAVRRKALAVREEEALLQLRPLLVVREGLIQAVEAGLGMLSKLRQVTLELPVALVVPVSLLLLTLHNHGSRYP
jgi:hypothetical protein